MSLYICFWGFGIDENDKFRKVIVCSQTYIDVLMIWFVLYVPYNTMNVKLKLTLEEIEEDLLDFNCLSMNLFSGRRTETI